MTLKELVQSVNTEEYSDHPLFAELPKTQLLDAILEELSEDGFTNQEHENFWSDFDNLQKAKIIR